MGDRKVQRNLRQEDLSKVIKYEKHTSFSGCFSAKDSCSVILTEPGALRHCHALSVH